MVRRQRRRAGQHFYPRSPRGERRNIGIHVCIPFLISIHAPREGSDRDVLVLNVKAQSISIHAPREGSDPLQHRHLRQQRDFYPRSPRGERLHPGCPVPRHGHHFYPRSPRGERPVWVRRTGGCRPISIHAPREGSDVQFQGCSFVVYQISIHAPREGSDRVFTTSFAAPDRFLSTLPARGATTAGSCRLSAA